MHLRALGDRGERMARAHLTEAGMRVLETNLRIGGGELDIVALESDVVVFVEVKTRRPGLQRPAESLSFGQIRRISRAAAAYLQRRGWLEREVRFDVMEMEYGGDSLRVNHLRAAFDYTE